jgi:hypothetical protein
VEHAHSWKPVPGSGYALRRCSECRILAKTSNGVVKIQLCSVCKQPASYLRLGSTFCDAHLTKPGNLRTLREMSEEEIQALEKLYGVPVRRPS